MVQTFTRVVPAFLCESTLKGSAVKTEFNSVIYLVMSMTLRYANNHLQTKWGQGQVWERIYREHCNKRFQRNYDTSDIKKKKKKVIPHLQLLVRKSACPCLYKVLRPNHTPSVAEAAQTHAGKQQITSSFP